MRYTYTNRLREYHRQEAVVAAWNSALNHCHTLEETIRKHRRKGTLGTPAFKSEIKSVYQQTRSQFHGALPTVSKPQRHWRLLYQDIIKDTTGGCDRKDRRSVAGSERDYPPRRNSTQSRVDTFRLTAQGFLT